MPDPTPELPYLTDEERELLAKARAATPGPWRVDDASWIEVNDISVYCGPEDAPQCLCNMGAPVVAVGNREEAEVSFANGTYVAAADPNTIIRLLTALDAARGEADRLRDAL